MAMPFGLAVALFPMSWQPAAAQAKDARPSDAQTEEGMEIQARGPIHEAFAQPHAKDPGPLPIIQKKPPPPIPEQPPDQKPEGENVQWIPGYWSWDTDRNDFLWVSGFWRTPPPGRNWVPGHWTQAGNGWQWVEGMWLAANQDLQYLPQPPASVEIGPSAPAPDDNSLYIPGSWQYRNNSYAWRPGFWNQAYSDWVWNPSYYNWTPSGYCYVNGYWDYPFANRGLLFAPIFFNRPLFQDPGFFFRPYCAVPFNDFFLSSLFVNRHHFFFGDFFSPFHARHGFWPWHSWGRQFNDPLFNHLAWQHRGNPNWFADQRHDFWARRNGDLPRPPHTFNPRAANVLAANGSRRNLAGGQNLVTPLNQLHNHGVSLSRVSPAQLQQHQATAQHFGQTSMQRNRTEFAGNRAVPSGAGRQSFNAGAGQQSFNGGAARQSFYSGPRINNGGAAHNAGQFRELSSVHQTAPRGFQAPAARYAAPAYRGSSHAMPSHARSAPSFHSGASFHGGNGGGSHGGGGHKH